MSFACVLSLVQSTHTACIISLGVCWRQFRLYVMFRVYLFWIFVNVANLIGDLTNLCVKERVDFLICLIVIRNSGTYR